MNTITHINGVPIDQIPIHGADIGIPIQRLSGFILRGNPSDPIGGSRDGQLVVYNDWRLRELQAREGVEVLPDPSLFTVVAVVDES